MCVCMRRHGAHNWEGVGALSALTAVDSLARLTHSHSWLQRKSSPHFVLFAGQFFVTPAHLNTLPLSLLIETQFFCFCVCWAHSMGP